MKRLASTCLTVVAGCGSCGDRFFVPRALRSSVVRNYASTTFIKNADRKGEETDPSSVLKAKGKATRSISLDLPEEKKQVSLCSMSKSDKCITWEGRAAALSRPHR